MKSPGQGPSPGPLSGAAMLADARGNPRPLVIAALAQALQAALLVGLGVATCVVGITGDSDVLNAELVGVLSLAGGIGLLAVARGLLAARSWARAPSLVWQLIMVPVGFTTADDLPGAAYPLLGSAAVVLAGLFAPSTGAALQD